MSDVPGSSWPPEYAGAAMLLQRAANFADSLHRSPWDFAVERAELRRLGLTVADLRWLICQGLVEHADELPSSPSGERLFQSTGELSFRRSTCFILTPLGRAAALHLTSTKLPFPGSPTAQPFPSARDRDPQSGANRPSSFAEVPVTDPHSSPPVCELERPESTAFSSGQSSKADVATSRSSNGTGTALRCVTLLKPNWDKDLNRLTLGDVLVKEFKTPAPNQQMILNAFQEEGWPPRIDDPLPPHPDLEPKRRLHETIISLNRNQRNSVLRFCGDGNGLGVRWIIATPATSSQATCIAPLSSPESP